MSATAKPVPVMWVCREDFWARVDRSDPDGCWPWRGQRTPRGYGVFSIGARTHRAHRVAFALVHGAIPDGLSVLHHCDNPACCRPEHLYAGTHEDNMRDRGVRGRAATGERHGSRTKPESRVWGVHVGTSRLTEGQVIEIRRLHAAGGNTQRGLAREYGVSNQTIRRIITGETWAHLPLHPSPVDQEEAA